MPIHDPPWEPHRVPGKPTDRDETAEVLLGYVNGEAVYGPPDTFDKAISPEPVQGNEHPQDF